MDFVKVRDGHLLLNVAAVAYAEVGMADALFLTTVDGRTHQITDPYERKLILEKAFGIAVEAPAPIADAAAPDVAPERPKYDAARAPKGKR